MEVEKVNLEKSLKTEMSVMWTIQLLYREK